MTFLVLSKYENINIVVIKSKNIIIQEEILELGLDDEDKVFLTTNLSACDLLA